MTLITLADGRKLDIAVSGPADGVPVVLHQTTPGAKAQYRVMQRAAHARGLRLVTFSRPGYGKSTRLARRAIVDIVADVEAVLDHLGADRSLQVGWSGGGPHALAAAAKLPDRVAGVATIAGVGPYGVAGLDFLAGMGEMNILEFGAALEGEHALRTLLVAEAPQLRDAGPAGFATVLGSMLAEIDHKFITPETAEDTAATFAEGLSTGVDGWLDDDLAFVSPWEFDLREIAVPSFVWQGTEDYMVPFAHGEWLAEHIPGAVAHLERGQGHMSIALGSIEPILEELAKTI